MCVRESVCERGRISMCVGVYVRVFCVFCVHVVVYVCVCVYACISLLSIRVRACVCTCVLMCVY